MTEPDAHFRLRLPSSLKNEIERSAHDRGSSINAEIIRRIEGVNDRTERLEKFLREELAELRHDMPHIISDRDERKNQLQAALDVLLTGKEIEGERMAELRYELRLAQARLDDWAGRLRRIERVLEELK